MTLLALKGEWKLKHIDKHLLVDVSKSIQYFPEESPQPILVLVQAVIYCVP